MVKGPSLLGANLGLMICYLRFLASNQTLSPLEKGVKRWWVHEAITCLASSWAASASLWAADSCCR